LESDQSLNFSKNFRLFERKRCIKGFEISSYFAATVEQSAISTRSKAQKINNVSQDAIKSAQKVRQSKRKEKSASVKNNLEATVEQSVRNESTGAEVTFKKSAKKATRRRLNLDKGADTPVAREEQNTDTDSIRILRDKHCDSIAMVKLVKTDLFQLNASKDLDSEKMPNRELQQLSVTNAKTSPVIITPKSTPPKLSLTPHRSKKTPKKSPISLGSPKTHSIAIPKLLKSPRKLSLAVTGENSEENLEKSDSDSHSKKSRKRKKKSLSNSPMSEKGASISPIAKNKHKKSDINLKIIVRKFSKSPKIVLKSPKSKKSKSRKLKLLSPTRLSMLKMSPSPGTTSNLKSAKSSRSTKESPLFKGKSLSPIKRRLLNPKLIKTLTASQIKDVLVEPIVLLEKLSPESMKQKYLLMVASKTQSDVSKQDSSIKLRNNSVEKSQASNINRISPRIKYDKLIQKKDKSPLMSSTPREEKMTSARDTSSNTSIDSVNNASFNTRLRHKNQFNMQLSSTVDKSTDIENVSRPSLFDKEIGDTSRSPLSNVMKQDTSYKDDTMEKKQENNTYELEQPQTLSLRQMIRKRTSTDANLSLRDNVKKTKVRFADVTFGAGSAQKSINKLNGSQSSISHNVNVRHRNNVINSAQKSTKKVETSKFTQNSLISPFKRSSPRIHGDTPRAQLSRIQITPKTLTSEKKSGKTIKNRLFIHLF